MLIKIPHYIYLDIQNYLKQRTHFLRKQRQARNPAGNASDAYAAADVNVNLEAQRGTQNDIPMQPLQPPATTTADQDQARDTIKDIYSLMWSGSMPLRVEIPEYAEGCMMGRRASTPPDVGPEVPPP